MCSGAVTGLFFWARSAFVLGWLSERRQLAAAAEGLLSPRDSCRRGLRVRTVSVPSFSSVTVAGAFGNMSSSRDSAFEKQHLWMYLQALGLDPSSSIMVGGKMMPHVHLGE